MRSLIPVLAELGPEHFDREELRSFASSSSPGSNRKEIS